MKKKGLSFPAIILIVVFFIVLAITSFFIAPIIKEKFDGRDSPSSLINDSQAQAGTTNSGGDTNTDMNSNEETPTQEESNEKAEELIDLQEQIPNCTEADWVYNISPVDCPLIGNQTKTWNKIGNCENGIEHDSSEIISCNPDIPTCTNFTYSDWGDCISSGTQSRSVLSSSPNGCVGGNPTIFQSCTYIAPFCSTGIKAISNTCNWALKDNVRVI